MPNSKSILASLVFREDKYSLNDLVSRDHIAIFARGRYRFLYKRLARKRVLHTSISLVVSAMHPLECRVLIAYKPNRCLQIYYFIIGHAIYMRQRV